jgi:hypothetical protein
MDNKVNPIVLSVIDESLLRRPKVNVDKIRTNMKISGR